MNIKEAKQQITDTLRAYLTRDELGSYLIPSIRQRPILLMGPPGIGKTQIMAQIAHETGVGLVAYTITHHTRQSAVGLPFLEKRVYDGREYTVTEYTMSEILASVQELMKKTGLREGILFLDEINCVSETLAPMMLQFLQCKTFGNQALPEGWLIVAAGNPPEYNRSVREFDVVTLDRVRRLDVSEDYAVWKDYARSKGLHGAILSYLDIRREDFYRIETTADGPAYVTARGWEDLSELLFAYEKLGLTADRTVVEQYLRISRVAKDFAAYLALYYKYRETYHVDEILAGAWDRVTESAFRSAPFDEKLAVMGLLLSRLSRLGRKTRQQDALTDALHTVLRGCQAQGGSLREALCGELRSLQERMEREKAAGQLDKPTRELLLRECSELERYLAALAPEADDAMDCIRPLFAAQVDRRSAAAQETGDAFDHTFAFLERAAGASQEMVMFVTELTAGADTSWFVENFGCDAYFRNNRELLFDDTRRQLLSEITGRQQ